ncbi:TPA: terminase [Morganella morganii]
MTDTVTASPEEQLIDDIAMFTHDPLSYALYAFPWGEAGTELAHATGPRSWQRWMLDAVGEHLRNPDTRHQPLMIAVSSGHGIGKSAGISMLLNWGMSTCEDCKAVITANTDNQLRTKTWPEVIKWANLSITKDWFSTPATAMYSNDPGHDKRWRADAIPWSEHNTEAFAGLHNERKRIILVFDEASNIADKVWEVAEGALTDEDTEIIWVAFGNPTRNTGRFRECFRKYKHRWVTKQIDSRTVEGTNKEQIQKWIEDYGEDSDFVKIRVRGIFPSASETQFIPTGLTDAAMKRTVTAAEVAHAPVIIGVDPAYSGADDAVIYMRQGLHCKCLWTGNKTTDDILMAKRIADFEDRHQADAVHIDFGYGTGIYSVGMSWGRDWQLVKFGGASTDPQMLNKRGEMYNSVKAWLKIGGALDDQETADDLSSAEYKVQLDGKILLEAKDDIKKRIGRSPGKGDALALTFAYPVTKKDPQFKQNISHGSVVADNDYDPWA